MILDDEMVDLLDAPVLPTKIILIDFGNFLIAEPCHFAYLYIYTIYIQSW